ncbi:MAG: response regulator [Thermoproteota archaeon]|jgi:CheY-like chemotaxis protein|nr:response regulator [Thermoproteota archaeon]
MSSPTTVMVCDDEADLLYLFRSVLEPTYRVLAVESGRGCIEKFIEEKQKGRKVDVLLLDYKLGDMLGDIVACKIHELNGVKTFLISAYELEQTLVDHLLERQCIIGVMRKPLRMSAMIKEVEKALGDN